MRQILAATLLLFLTFDPAWAARRRRPVPVAQKTTRKASTRKQAGPPRVARAKAVSTKWVRGRRGKRVKQPAAFAAARPRYRQSGPSSERYREIQKALADKGYYKGPQDGNWDADSIAALRKFQADQSLKGDGKLDSMSLIALGLGPKRETAPPAMPIEMR